MNASFDFESLDCQDVNSLNLSSQKCFFAHQRDDCFDEDGWVNYPLLFYCVLSSDSSVVSAILPLLVSACLLVVYFTAMGMTAEDFMCPSLASISKSLRLSENVAGVTLLALGNGAPDIFASIAGVRQARPELVIGELFGGGVFVITVVVGAIFLTGEFKVMERPISRDIFFYATACFIVWSICFQGTIYLWHAILVLIIYVLYIVVVIVGRMIYQKNLIVETDSVIMTGSSTTELRVSDELRRRASSTLSSLSGRRYSANRIVRAVEEARSRSSSVISAFPDVLPILPVSPQLEKRGRFADLVHQFIPPEWKKPQSKWSVLYSIVKFPLKFALTLTIPVIDPDDYSNSWSQILNCIHVITGPLMVATAAGATRVSISGFPCMAIIAIVTSVFAVITFLTSKPDKPPVYYFAFSILTFVVSCCWTYILASEVVALLETLGFMFNISEAILGLTVLAWGNSIADLIANVSLARLGFQRMAISACFGGPLLNLLLGIGIPYAIALPETGTLSLKLEYTLMFTLLICTLMLALGVAMVIFLATGFRSLKYHGIALIVIYLMYLIAAIVIELHNE